MVGDYSGIASNATLVNSHFENNNAGPDQPGDIVSMLYMYGTQLVRKNTFVRNYGMAVFSEGHCCGTEVVLEDNEFSYNEGYHGGAHHCTGGSIGGVDVVIPNNEFTGNTAVLGAALYEDSRLTISIESNTFHDQNESTDIHFF